MKKFLEDTVEEYWSCSRCEIDSMTEGRMVPCPRGSCDALHMGDLIIKKTINFNKTDWFYRIDSETKKINLKEIHPNGDILTEVDFESWSDMATYAIQNQIIVTEKKVTYE
jgi:hypothetical protein